MSGKTASEKTDTEGGCDLVHSSAAPKPCELIRVEDVSDAIGYHRGRESSHFVLFSTVGSRKPKTEVMILTAISRAISGSPLCRISSMHAASGPSTAPAEMLMENRAFDLPRNAGRAISLTFVESVGTTSTLPTERSTQIGQNR